MKQIDLEPGEYHHIEVKTIPHREPFWGPEAYMFFGMFALAFPIHAMVYLTVYGALPRYLQHLLQ